MSLEIPVSVLDVVNIREGETARDAINNSVRMAQEAEALGYKRFWLAEHHNMPSIASTSTTLLISRVADYTQSIRVGSGGIMLPNHAPLSVAEAFGTLSTMYPERIDLGLGRALGTDGHTAAALRQHFGSVHYDFKASIEEVQSYFSTAEENKSKRVRAYISEGKEVPIWILGSSTDSAYLAAAMGLPYAFAAHFAPSQLAVAAKIYKQHFKPSAYLNQPYFMACVNVIAADTNDEAQLLATTVQQLFAGILTNTRTKLPPPIANYANQMDVHLFAALQQMLQYTFIGDIETLREQLMQFIQTLKVDELMVANYIFDLDKRHHSMGLLRKALM